MGKSTTARLFADEGCAIWDADAAVHRLYSKGGSAVEPLSADFPDTIVEGAVCREHLREIISKNADTLRRIESIVHPLVAADRKEFLNETDAEITVLDIPLLFETGSDAQMDATVCVTAPPEIQKERVMARGKMTEAQFNAIRAKQMPDEEKRAKADFVIVADTLEHAREQVQDVLKQIRDRLSNA